MLELDERFAVQGYNYLVSPETTTLVYRYRSEQSIAVRGCVAVSYTHLPPLR